MKIIDLFFPSQIKCVTCGVETNTYGICENCEKNKLFITLCNSKFMY